MCGTSTTTQNQSSNNNSWNILPQWQTDAGYNNYNSASGYAAQNPYQAYSGPTTASFGNEWGKAADYAGSQLGQTNPALAQVLGQAGKTAGSSVQDLMNPYVQATLTPTLDAITRNAATTNNGLAASATMSGAFGDSGYGVQKSLADKDTQSAIANATGAAYSQAYNNAQTQQNTALQQLLQGSSQDSAQKNAVTQQLASMGSTEQGANAQGIQNQMTVNNEQNSGQLNQFATLQSILRGAPVDTNTQSYGNGTTTSTQPDNSGMALAGKLLS